jgi:hypothetical protein
LCTNKNNIYRLSAALYADAYGAEPKLASDLKAATATTPPATATLAAAERREDAPEPDGPRPCALPVPHTSAPIATPPIFYGHID